MTVSSQNSVVRYIGNGIVKEFTVPFKFFEENDIMVYISSEKLPETRLILNDDYFVFGAGEEVGGKVLFKVTPDPDEKVTVVRLLPMTQEVDYRENEIFPAETHEMTLDKLTMMVQQNSEKISRCLSLGVTSNDSPDQILPAVFDAKAICVAKANEAVQHVDVIKAHSDHAAQKAEISQLQAERALLEADRATQVAQETSTIIIQDVMDLMIPDYTQGLWIPMNTATTVLVDSFFVAMAIGSGGIGVGISVNNREIALNYSPSGGNRCSVSCFVRKGNSVMATSNAASQSYLYPLKGAV